MSKRTTDLKPWTKPNTANQYISVNDIPSRSLTVRPWKVTFPIGKDRLPVPSFLGRTVKLREGNHNSQIWHRRIKSAKICRSVSVLSCLPKLDVKMSVTCSFSIKTQSLKLTVCTCQEAGPQNTTSLPTIHFQLAKFDHILPAWNSPKQTKPNLGEISNVNVRGKQFKLLTYTVHVKFYEVARSDQNWFIHHSFQC